MTPRKAFTLIELLVVVTIIVILLALLTPALDKAIYQAELVVCMTNQRAAVTGLHMYTVDFKRRYPHRGGVNDEANTVNKGISFSSWRDTSLRTVDPFGDYDDRAALKGYIVLNSHLNCPLNPELDLDNDLETPDPMARSNTECPYQLWYGFQFRRNGDGTPEPGLLKLGDRLRFTDWTDLSGRTAVFDVLVSDMDDFLIPNNVVLGTHPDRDGVMGHLFQQDFALFTISRWQSAGTVKRGLIDRNFAHGDGSASRIAEITVSDSQDEKRGLERVPIFSNGGGYNGSVGQYSTLPKQ